MAVVFEVKIVVVAAVVVVVAIGVSVSGFTGSCGSSWYD